MIIYELFLSHNLITEFVVMFSSFLFLVQIIMLLLSSETYWEVGGWYLICQERS
jgi:hypothetical protein